MLMSLPASVRIWLAARATVSVRRTQDSLVGCGGRIARGGPGRARAPYELADAWGGVAGPQTEREGDQLLNTLCQRRLCIPICLDSR
jgi:hypothetical protein